MKFTLAMTLGLAFLTSCATDKPAGNPEEPANGVPTPKNFKVAYVGDQGANENSVAVLKLIKSEQADLAVIAGDFDYHNDPARWSKMLEDTVGDMPLLAAVGNHDVKKWAGYETVIRERQAKMPKAHCSGQIGVNQTCLYEGILFALSGVGTLGAGHEAYLKQALASARVPFKVCVWHKNQRLMQVGSKRDEVGWGVYETCREAGAMVVTGHEHSYERTYLLDSFERQLVATKSNAMTLSPGRSLAFVSGLGGREIRGLGFEDDAAAGEGADNRRLDKGGYWAKIYTKVQQAQYGAVFCEYNVENDPRRAHCYFKNVSGEIVDDFHLLSQLP